MSGSLRRMRERELEQELLCERWKHPVGTYVKVRRDDGREIPTCTASMPWMLGSKAVILVDGISGGYSLDRVSVV